MEDDKLYLNRLFITYNNEIVLLVIILYFFNLKLGLIGTIFYVLIYLLNIHKMRYYNTHENKGELFDNIRVPTMNNPYSNYTLNENPELEAPKDKKYNQTMREYNKVNVFENSYDKNISLQTIGSFDKSLRDFYTMPITTYPNNAKDFATWTYLDRNRTCKGDNDCLQYDDIRYHSR